jgi:CRISPR-associated endonuclease/helicase Cas3
MSELRSHPHLTLREHLGQIRQAAAAIWARHSSDLVENCVDARQWFDDAVCLHDAGKASQAFQEYIGDPVGYLRRHLPDTKAHTPLSTVCTLEHGRKVDWNWRHVLAVAQIAAGHHSEFKTLQDLERGVCNDRMTGVMTEQITNLDWHALDRAIGIVLPRLTRRSGLDLACEVSDYLEELVEQLHGLPSADAVCYRLLCQLAYSVLLEADKAFLAVKEIDRADYLKPRSAELLPQYVDDRLAKKPVTNITPLQQRARHEMFARLAGGDDVRIHTLTLPTGTGKTLLAASWALTLREQIRNAGSPPPLLLIVLPYLAIIDQTVTEYQAVFKGRVEPGELISYHSLADRTYAPDLEDESQDFFLDTWQSNVVITTFDQFLFALLSPKGRHQMRFHHLADALIVMDEVQALPCVLWDPVRHVLDGLTRIGTTRVLAMSATQPGFLPATHKLVDSPEAFFTEMKRYRLVLRHRNPMKLLKFIEKCKHSISNWQTKRVLLTLNTRRSARALRDALEQPAKEAGVPLEFLTADVTPLDRLAAIDRIKNGAACLVVSTQCIEAGVDIDMDLVIRDFAPLDSLIQVAGRCNRFNLRERGTVEIVSLLDDENQEKPLAAYVYNDKILLPVTAEVLGKRESIDEEGILPIITAYFDRLAEKKDAGEAVTQAWARWEEFDKSVRELLRGSPRAQVAFVVIDKDPNLRDALDNARDTAKQDRWAGRRALKRLAGRIAQITVSVPNPRKKINPSDFAEPYPPDAKDDAVWFWLLNDKYYTPARGIDIQGEHTDDSWGIIL